jgi:hypothetical protein
LCIRSLSQPFLFLAAESRADKGERRKGKDVAFSQNAPSIRSAIDVGVSRVLRRTVFRYVRELCRGKVEGFFSISNIKKWGVEMAQQNSSPENPTPWALFE